MKNNENVKERKSFKEVVVENKGKIIAGVSIVTAATVGVVLYKNAIDIKNLSIIVDSQVKLNEVQGEFNNKSVECAKRITDELVKVRDIAKEGALEEAIAAVKRKIQYRVGKISDLSARPLDNDALISKELLEKELIILKDKLTMFENEWNNMLH
jgi:hypothetical protein